MPDGYVSSGSSRGSTPSPRNSSSFQERLPSYSKGNNQDFFQLPIIHVTYHAPDPKQSYTSRYTDTHLTPQPPATLSAPRKSSSSSRSSSGHHSSSSRQSNTIPLSIHQHSNASPSDGIRSNKNYDARYLQNSSLDPGEPRKYTSSLARKDYDARYRPDSAYHRD